MNKLKLLQITLDNLNLKSEAANIYSLIKISRHTDEYLEAKGNYKSLSPQERRKILSNFDIYKTLTEQQRSDIGHNLLDSIGMVPGPGDVADILNVIWYAKQKNYGMAAISSVFLVPGLGTPAAALAKTTKVLPAKMVFEFSDEFASLISKLEPEIPNGSAVKEAVEYIIESAKRGYDINMTTGKAIVESASKEVKDVKKSVVKAVDPENAWYMNPKWQDWFLEIARPALTMVFNGINERAFKTRLMKGAYNDHYLKMLRSELGLVEYDLVPDRESVDFYKSRLLSSNTEITKRISASIPRLTEELKSTIKLKLITKSSDIPDNRSNTFGQANLITNEILIFLPNFSRYITSPTYLIQLLQYTIRHEVWHCLDSKIIKSLNDLDYGSPIGGRLISESYGISGGDGFGHTIDSLKDIFKYNNIPSHRLEYFKDNSEIYVRIKSLRQFSKKIFKKDPDYNELLTLIKAIDNLKYNIPQDAKELLELLKNCSDDEIKMAASLMDKLP